MNDTANTRTETKVIRQAAELAEGWAPLDAQIGVGIVVSMNDLLNKHPYMLDALAAQLVRQVDNIGGQNLMVNKHGVEITSFGMRGEWVSGPDRTMNTIKAIVESGVLA